MYIDTRYSRSIMSSCVIAVNQFLNHSTDWKMGYSKLPHGEDGDMRPLTSLWEI